MDLSYLAIGNAGRLRGDAELLPRRQPRRRTGRAGVHTNAEAGRPAREPRLIVGGESRVSRQVIGWPMQAKSEGIATDGRARFLRLFLVASHCCSMCYN